MIKLALVGHGRWGNNIKRTLQALPEVELAALANSAAQTKNLLKRSDLDGVLVATPGSTHARVALPFIKKGLPTFIEKPLATNLRDAQALQRVAQRSKALIFVGHIHLYNPAYQKTKSLAKQAGRLRVLSFESMAQGPVRGDMSVLWDWAPHDVAMALDLLGRMPESIQAWGLELLPHPKNHRKLYDAAQIKIKFPQNIAALISVSWVSPEKKMKATIIGARGSIVFDDTAARKVTHYGARAQRQPKISYPDYSKVQPLTAELKEFVQMIKAKKPPLTNVDHGVDVVRIIAVAEQSIKFNGRPIKFSG